jgi:aminoglycoside phosphotransferase (APT) family kinase protein
MSIKPSLDVGAQVAQMIVDRVCPGAAVASVARIHGGEIAAIHEIGLSNGASLVLKLYPDFVRWKMSKEAGVARLIDGRLGVASPRVLLTDDSKQLLDLNFLVMTKLGGSSLGWLLSSLTVAQRASAYGQIGRLLRDFHRIPMQAFGYIGGDGISTRYATNHDYVTSQFDRKLKEFVDRGGTSELARRIEQHVATRTHLLNGCTGPVLCHNDLHAGNLLTTVVSGDARLTGVLDFEGALAGDPLKDIAKALYYLDDADRQAVLTGYGDTGRTRAEATLALYHLLFVLELWCWMAQIGNPAPLARLALDLERFSAA